MSDKTEISWSDATWNPIIGCTKVSPGCDHCYPIPLSRIREKNPNPKVAAAFAGVVEKTASGLDWTGRVNLLPERLDQPLKWRKPRRVFVNSLADLFHEQVPDRFISEVFNRMGAAPRHTFQVLTKRHGRMRSLLKRWSEHAEKGCYCPADQGGCSAPVDVQHGVWPLPNVWLGVSVESQQWAETRIPALLETPAAVRFISAEPLLGPVDLRHLKVRNRVIDCLGGDVTDPSDGAVLCGMPSVLDWVIVGGESGPGSRPMHPKWVKDLRDECQQAGVAYHFKQWGEYIPVPIEDDPAFSGGRAYNNPRTGGRSAVVIREPAARNRHFEGGRLLTMQPGDETVGGVIMLDHDTLAVRVGKKRAGRELDGRTWDDFPETREVAHRG